MAKVIKFSLIVKRALLESVTDIGQLSEGQLRDLRNAVNRGLLCKGKGGPFPILKTVYAKPGFDFSAQRAGYIAEMELARAIDCLALGRTAWSEVRFQ